MSALKGGNSPINLSWLEGYYYGFDDNYIKPWEYRYYSASFLAGYRAGKAEINELVEIVVQARNTGGEDL